MVCLIFHYLDTYHSCIFVLKLFSCIFLQKNPVILLDFSPKSLAILVPLSRHLHLQGPSHHQPAQAFIGVAHCR